MGVDLRPLTENEVEDLLEYENHDPRKEYKAHIINEAMNTHVWRPGMNAQDVVDLARLRGIMLTALCGYTFVPKHNPDKFPACDRCMDVAGQIISEGDGT